MAPILESTPLLAATKAVGINGNHRQQQQNGNHITQLLTNYGATTTTTTASPAIHSHVDDVDGEHSDAVSDLLDSSTRSGGQRSIQNNRKRIPQQFTDSMRELSRQISGVIQQVHTGSIGYLGSMAIAVNSLTGPAMVNLPATFARSGIIPTIFTLLFVCILAALCSLHMANSISKVPGNADFKKEVEFSDAFRRFWGHRWFLVSQLLFTCCITCLNISSIVDTAHVVDTFIGHWVRNGTAAVTLDTQNYYYWKPTIIYWAANECPEEVDMEGLCLPFANVDGIFVTVGNVITTVLLFPLALMDLKENAWVQIVGFLILLITSCQFIWVFFGEAVSQSAHSSNLTWWGYDWDDLLGVVLFNFALVIAIPAWLYEREPHVDVPTVIVGSSSMSVVLYIAIGILGCMAIPNVSDNMLESMMSGAFGTGIQLGASIFAFAIIGLGIPLFSVLTRLNLTGSGLCSTKVANLIAVYLPFGVSWLLYGGDLVTKVLSWGGVCFTSLVAFILPLTLAHHIVQTFDYEGSVSVYFDLIRGKRSELIALRVLLAVAILSIIAAIVGNLIDY